MKTFTTDEGLVTFIAVSKPTTNKKGNPVYQVSLELNGKALKAVETFITKEVQYFQSTPAVSEGLEVTQFTPWKRTQNGVTFYFKNTRVPKVFDDQLQEIDVTQKHLWSGGRARVNFQVQLYIQDNTINVYLTVLGIQVLVFGGIPNVDHQSTTPFNSDVFKFSGVQK